MKRNQHRTSSRVSAAQAAKVAPFAAGIEATVPKNGRRPVFPVN
jgi:hypothetical protein